MSLFIGQNRYLWNRWMDFLYSKFCGIVSTNIWSTSQSFDHFTHMSLSMFAHMTYISLPIGRIIMWDTGWKEIILIQQIPTLYTIIKVFDASKSNVVDLSCVKHCHWKRFNEKFNEIRSLNFFLRVQLTISRHCFRYMNQWWRSQMTHMCVIRP